MEPSDGRLFLFVAERCLIMRNIKLLLEYDGTDFVGWQTQSNGRSVQEELEKATAQILQEKVSIIGAGRTDAGVHARGQVANFRTEKPFDVDSLHAGLNGVLPQDIVVHRVEEVDIAFHARYDAVGRRYQYYISKISTALWRKYCWHVKFPLDVRLMNQAAQFILGTHDFESFCKANSDSKHFFCTINDAHWYEESERSIFNIRANRFLHGMIRALVGTMVDVGRGYTSLEYFLEILEKKNRSGAGMSAPPQGLFLEEVLY